MIVGGSLCPRVAFFRTVTVLVGIQGTEFTIYSWSWRSSAVEGLYSECECGLHCPVTRTHVPIFLKVTAEAAEVLGGEVA